LLDREALAALLKDEIVQKMEEDCEVREIAAKLSRTGRVASEETLEIIYRELQGLSPRADFPYVESSDLEEIKRQRVSGLRKIELALSDKELYDRIYGAWLGRCIGCMLGTTS